MIRLAQKKDHLLVDAILRQAQAYHVALRPDLYRPCEQAMDAERFDALVGEQCILVAEDEERGTIAGVLIFTEKAAGGPLCVPRHALYIDSLAVAEEHRGRGWGSALLAEARRLAEVRGFQAVELQVNAANADALALYRRLGFTEKAVTLELEL